MLAEKDTLDLETVLAEKEFCNEMIARAEDEESKLQQEFDQLQKRIDLLGVIDRRRSNDHTRGNLELAVEKRTDLARKLSAQKANVQGYREILEVVEVIEKELA